MELLISAKEAMRISKNVFYHIQAEAYEKLDRSRAKRKGEIDELVWFIMYSESVTEGHLPKDATVEEKRDDIVSRTHASLAARMPLAFVSVELERVPQVLVDEIHIRVLKAQGWRGLHRDSRTIDIFWKSSRPDSV